MIKPALVLFAVLAIAISCSTVAHRKPAGDVVAYTQSVSEAEALIARQVKLFDSGIYATSSFANESELSAAVGKLGGDYQLAWDILKNEDVEVTINANEASRSKILASGPKNTHETHTSNGVNNQDQRNSVESLYLNLDFETYSAKPDNVKPKYGYLRPKPNSRSAGLHPPYSVWSYGEDYYTLNLERIRNRLTVTAGDSLNNLVGALDPDTQRLRDNQAQFITGWPKHFTPWSMRTLLTPVLAQAMSAPLEVKGEDGKQQTLGHVLGTRVWTFVDSEDHVQEQGGFGGLAGAVGCSSQALSDNHGNSKLKIRYTLCSSFEKKGVSVLANYCPTAECSWSMDYLEAQIWGEINMSDIKAFTYTKTPPSADQLAILKANGIEIRDGRVKAKSR